jgi:hypothetical protein
VPALDEKILDNEAEELLKGLRAEAPGILAWLIEGAMPVSSYDSNISLTCEGPVIWWRRRELDVPTVNVRCYCICDIFHIRQLVECTTIGQTMYPSSRLTIFLCCEALGMSR